MPQSFWWRTYLVVILLHCACELLLQDKHDILYISTGHHLEGDTECFTLDLHILTALLARMPEEVSISSPIQHLENIHDHPIQYVLVL